MRRRKRMRQGRVGRMRIQPDVGTLTARRVRWRWNGIGGKELARRHQRQRNRLGTRFRIPADGLDTGSGGRVVGWSSVRDSGRLRRGWTALLVSPASGGRRCRRNRKRSWSGTISHGGIRGVAGSRHCRRPGWRHGWRRHVHVRRTG